MPQLDVQSVSIALLGLGLVYGISKVRKIGAREPNLPPGPPTIPLLGNLNVFPKEEAYLRFAEWAKVYGHLFSLKIGPQTMIIISSMDALYEILEKNGAVTSDKPRYEPFRRIAGKGGVLAFEPYGPSWRKLRKAASELMKPSTREKNTPIQIAETYQLLYDTLENPDGLYYHIQRYTSSAIFAMMGGTRIPNSKSPLNTRYFKMWDDISHITEPGNTPPVDLMPILNYIPERFSGHWKARTQSIHDNLRSMLSDLLSAAQKRLNEGQPNGCFLEVMTENAQAWGLDDDDIRTVAGGLLLGGAVSTCGLLQWSIFLAMAHPEAQRKVQEELDRVVGPNRPPTLQDLPNLQYLRAFVKEVHRFRPPTPLGGVHRVEEDVMYQDKLIPAGATVYINIWALFNREDIFENPDKFNPDRYMRSPNGARPGAENIMSPEAFNRLETIMFGIGRRKCVGMSLAQDVGPLITATLLWGFEFSAPVEDRNGVKDIPDLWAFTSGLTNDLFPFKCGVKPRSQKHVDIVRQNFKDSIPIYESYERELVQEDREYVEAVRAKLSG
ncbi:hypothetical protein FRC02_008940 [Tulasnella sp. 418]|nr:hypothetical protein FRC02_008940 [Tulasnella sp. 418]